jgi:hypothetical protein
MKKYGQGETCIVTKIQDVNNINVVNKNFENLTTKTMLRNDSENSKLHFQT